MELILTIVGFLVYACRGNPLMCAGTLFFIYALCNILMASVEQLIWGERFLHWFDIVVTTFFIVITGLSVWACAKYQEEDDQNKWG